MTTYYVMTVFLLAGFLDGGVATEKVGVYQSRSDCMMAGTDAGFTHISSDPEQRSHKYYFACVAAGDPYGVEE